MLEFLRFANSREGQETVAQSGVYPLTPSQVATNLDNLGEPARMARSGSSTIVRD